MRLEGQVGDQSGINHRLIMTDDYEVDNHRQSVIIISILLMMRLKVLSQ